MRKTFRAYHRSGDGSGAHTFVATSEGVKRDGLDLAMDGARWEAYMRNPVVLWAHDYRGSRLPIGKTETIEKTGDGKKWRAAIQFDMDDPFAAEVSRKLDDGYLSASSVGFNPLEREASRVTEWEILDLSIVPVPGDADALIERQRAYYAEELAALASPGGDGAGVVEPPPGLESSSSTAPHNAPPPSSKDLVDAVLRGDSLPDLVELIDRIPPPSVPEVVRGIDGQIRIELSDEDKQTLREAQRIIEDQETTVSIEVRGAVPPHTTDKQDETAEWDGPKQVAAADISALRTMHAWIDPDTKRAYLLAHHTATGEVNWRGTAAAMARLYQPGTQIPDEDRKGVWTHLARHYRQYGKEPPEYRTASDLDGMPPSLIDGMLPNGEWQILRETAAGEIGAAVDVLKTAIAEYEACNGKTENVEPGPDLEEISGDMAALLEALPEVPEKETE